MKYHNNELDNPWVENTACPACRELRRAKCIGCTEADAAAQQKELAKMREWYEQKDRTAKKFEELLESERKRLKLQQESWSSEKKKLSSDFN